MKRSRVLTCVTLLVGLLIGSIFGPALWNAAAGSGMHTYRCMSDNSADGGVALYINNTTSNPAHVTLTSRRFDGSSVSSGPLTPIAPHETVAQAITDPQIIVVELKTASKLFIDGVAIYLMGADPTVVRQVRCT